MKVFWPSQIVLLLILFFILISPWFWNGLYGFDWTDTTYHFQQALNVFNGHQIGSDFISHVPGLSFWLEAQFFNLLGANFLVHRILGLIFPLVTMISLAVMTNITLAELKPNQRILWSLTLSSIAVTSSWGQQIYWSFSALAPTISFILAVVIFFAIQKKSNLALLTTGIALASILSVQLLVKQSHGYVNIVLLYLVFGYICWSIRLNILNSLLVGFILLIVIFSTIFLITQLYCTNCFWEMTVFTGSSMELKGLSIKEPLDIISTILGVSGYKTILLLFVTSSAGVVSFFLSTRYSIFRHLLLVGLPFLAMSLLYVGQIKYLLHYISITFFFIQTFLVIRQSYLVKEFKKELYVSSGIALYFASFPIIGSVVAEQLSWPGIAYVRPQITLPLITMQGLSLLCLSRAKLSGKITPMISIILSILISILIVDPKPSRFDSKEAGTISMKKPSSFYSWEISPKTASAIEGILKASQDCSGYKLFQIAWMPIAYELTGRRNTTRYDLPYHDTISLKEAKSILKNLLSDPPGMLVIQQRYSEYSGPFPATGMGYLYKNLGQLLENYKLNSVISDNYNEFDLFCYKN